eukprot:g13346.t1
MLKHKKIETTRERDQKYIGLMVEHKEDLRQARMTRLVESITSGKGPDYEATRPDPDGWDLEAAARTTKPLAAPGSSLTTKELLRSQSRPVLEPDLWGMYGSSVFGRFNQILDPNNDGRSLRRQGRNAHLPSTNDGGGEVAGTKHSRLFGYHDKGVLQSHRDRGEATVFKSQEGSSCAAPAQDHFTYPEGPENALHLANCWRVSEGGTFARCSCAFVHMRGIALVEALTQWHWESNCFHDHVQRFALEHCDLFAAGNEEQCHEAYLLHRTFRQQLEGFLEAFLRVHETNLELLEEALKEAKCSEDLYTSASCEVVMEELFALLDYQSFLEVMQRATVATDRLFVKHTKTGNPLVDSVAEHQPANPRIYASHLGLPLDYVLLGGLVSIFQRNNGFYFMCLYGYIASHFSGKMSRLVLICGPIVSVACGIWCGFLLDMVIDPFLLLLGKKGYVAPTATAPPTSADEKSSGKAKQGKSQKGLTVRARGKDAKPTRRNERVAEVELEEWEEDRHERTGQTPSHVVAPGRQVRKTPGVLRGQLSGEALGKHQVTQPCLTGPAGKIKPYPLQESRPGGAMQLKRFLKSSYQQLFPGSSLEDAKKLLCVDSLGRRWLRLELLHFVSSTDGAVRLTVYGHLQRDRKYYAQALTLPLALQQKWHCALESLESDPLQARVASFFGYDAIAYCDFPVEGTFQELVTKDLRPWLLMGQVKEPAPSALRLCPAPQHLPRRYRLAACTQPLHSFAKLEKLAPSLLRDFLDYHSLLGIEHFTIFDADGTLAGPLERYKETAAVEFDYLDHWPKRFGAAHAEEGEQWRPLLFEVEAENHCLWRYRGQADWAVVLHSPDEFLHVPKSPGPNSLRHFLDALEPRSSIAHVELRQILFGGDVQPATTLPGRFRYREEGTEATAAVAHTVIVNVDNVAQAGVHPARPRPSLPSETPLRIVQADPMTDVRVNHYVNALGQERCGRKLCKAFVVYMLTMSEMSSAVPKYIEHCKSIGQQVASPTVMYAVQQRDPQRQKFFRNDHIQILTMTKSTPGTKEVDYFLLVVEVVVHGGHVCALHCLIFHDFFCLGQYEYSI